MTTMLKAGFLATLLASAAAAQSPRSADDALRAVALRVTALDVNRQLPSATLATIDSLLAFYSDSVLYEHPSVGAIVRGKSAMRQGMQQYIGSIQTASPEAPRVMIGPGVAVVDRPAGADPRDRSKPVPATRRAIRVLEFDSQGLVRRIIDYPW
jgi:hypothetical protein